MHKTELHISTTLHILYFTTTFRHAPNFGEDRSWHLTHLPHSTLRVSCYFCLAIKIILLQLKILTSLTFCCVCAFFLGLSVCWHHSLILGLDMWRPTMTTHDLYVQYYHIWPIKVSLYTDFFVFMHDRTPRTLLLSLSHRNILTDKIILLKQSFWDNLHPGYFITWERPLDTSSGMSPRYSSDTSSKHILSLQA